MKNQGNRYRKQLINRVWAFLLLGFFINAMIIEAVHHHHEQDQSVICKIYADKTPGAAHIHAAKIPCKLCEIIKQQSHHFDIPALYGHFIDLKTPIAPAIGYLPQHTVAYIHSATNKGPPSKTA